MTTVLIPTAGRGTRMMPLTEHTNKSLLEVDGRPILAQIIENFPVDTQYVIALGWCGEAVRDFCTLAYPDREFTWVYISDTTGELSGTGTTVRECAPHLRDSFWYVPCDTWFNEDLVQPSCSTLYVAQCETQRLGEYTLVRVVDGHVAETRFKTQPQDAHDWLCWTGVLYVHDVEQFFERLGTNTEVWTAIPPHCATSTLSTWRDAGNLDSYSELRSQHAAYDFTKSHEMTHICNGRVLKWWSDSSIVLKKYQRWAHNPSVYPRNVRMRGNWIAYDWTSGHTLYSDTSTETLQSFLNWCEKYLWINVDQHVDVSAASYDFYYAKSHGRVDAYRARYPVQPHVTHINGRPVRSFDEIWSKIDWSQHIFCNHSAYMHGDLQYDNIIVNDGHYTLIDWRHEYGSHTQYGDVYYDLAKLVGGWIINYGAIKRGEFGILHNDSNGVDLVMCSVANARDLIATLREWVQSRGLNWTKVRDLVPLIYWNMAALHSPPFDQYLWYLGILLSHDYEELL
jgi:choline kinase